MILSKTFTVDVKEFESEALRKAHEALRLTILDYALELKTGSTRLYDETNINAAVTPAAEAGFASRAFKTVNKLDVPKPMPTKEVDNDTDERPQVVAHDVADYKLNKIEPERVVQTAGSSSAKSKDDYLSIIFKDMKRTEKSEKIFSALLDAGEEGVATSDLSEALEMKPVDVSTWFSAKKDLKFIEKVSRGNYRINIAKLK